METIKFEIDIKASAERVWAILFGKETYPKWTTVFMEGSNVETDWQKGSKAIFSAGTENGMIAVIAENIPNQFMSIKHIGELKDGKEELKPEWGEVLENYTLTEKDGLTNLRIDMSAVEEWKEFFEDAWPKALNLVKAMAEEAA